MANYLNIAVGGLVLPLEVAGEETPSTEYGARAFTTAELGGGETAITSLPYEITAAGYYRLASDLTCDASGIAIKASNVTLDLNGYTITYGNGVAAVADVKVYSGVVSGNVGHAGIVCNYVPSENKDFSMGWSRRSGVVIKNGSIRDGSGTGLSYSPGILSSGLVGAELVDLDIKTVNSGGECICAVDSESRGNTYHYLTLEQSQPNADEIARHSLFAAIGLYGPEAYPNIVDHCWIKNSRQCGVKVGGVSTVTNNHITISSLVTNGYCVSAYGGSTGHHTVNDNIMIAVNGRGINISGTGNEARRNTITVQENSNDEYEELTVHGIKIEHEEPYECINNIVTDNDVTCTSGFHGLATPLNIDWDTGDTGNVVEGNTFRAVSDGTYNHGAFAFYTIGGRTGNAGTIRNNTFESDDHLIKQANPTDGLVFRECTFVGKSEAVVFYDGLGLGDPSSEAYASNMSFVDCVFTDVDFRTASFRGSDYTLDNLFQYSVEWSLTLTGSVGATGTLTSSEGVVTNWEIPEGGSLTIELPEYECIWHGDELVGYKEELEHSTYTLARNGGGSSVVTLTSAQTVAIPA